MNRSLIRDPRHKSSLVFMSWSKITRRTPIIVRLRVPNVRYNLLKYKRASGLSSKYKSARYTSVSHATWAAPPSILTWRPFSWTTPQPKAKICQSPLGLSPCPLSLSHPHPHPHIYIYNLIWDIWRLYQPDMADFKLSSMFYFYQNRSPSHWSAHSLLRLLLALPFIHSPFVPILTPICVKKKIFTMSQYLSLLCSVFFLDLKGSDIAYVCYKQCWRLKSKTHRFTYKNTE